MSNNRMLLSVPGDSVVNFISGLAGFRWLKKVST